MIFGGVCGEKIFVGGSRLPGIDGDVYMRARSVAKKSRAVVVGIATKKGVPVASGAVYLFKAILATWLDFELPED